jgi:RecA-family ATPase
MQQQNPIPSLLDIVKPDYCVVRPGNTNVSLPNIITGEELLLGKTEHIPFLLEGVLQSTGLACLAGSSDTGKSCLLRQLAIAVATGAETCFGFRLNTVYKSVIYVSTEDGRDATAFLLNRQAQHHTPEQVHSLRFLFDFEQLYADLDAALAQQPADLVVIDCFQDAYGGDLKDSQRIRIFLNQFQELAERRQCLFLFLHHTGKHTEDHKPSKNNLLSGQGLEAKMRLVIELRADLMDSSLRHLCIVKGNYLGTQSKKESYVLGFNEGAFTFMNTGERMPFDALVKKDGSTSTGYEDEKLKQIVKLRKEGYSQQKISLQMGIARTTVQRMLEKAKEFDLDEGAE